MGLLGGAIGFGMKTIGSIFGGIAASKAMKQVKNSLNQQKQQNQDWYDQRYNEDATQRADAQAAITRSKQDALDRNRAASSSSAVMGGTEESIAATKAASAKAEADVMSQIAVNAERRKDVIEQQFQAKDEALQSQLNDMERQKAAQTAQAIKGVASDAGNISGII